MSYDLFFFRSNGSTVSENDIREYLSSNLANPNKQSNQWFFENEDTEVYYSFDHNDPEDTEQHDGFEESNFSFNLNFMRPSFFGLEAFSFVETFMAELDLYILNPQSDVEAPIKATKEELFDNWNKTNLWASANNFSEPDCTYISPEISNLTWKYNFNRKNLQEQLGENYFVPKIAFMRTKKGNKAVTMTTWSEHIPIIVPPADYFLLGSQHKKLFRTSWKKRLISRETLINNFAAYFDDFEFEGCRIIHPEKAQAAGKKFHAMAADEVYESFLEKASIETLYNAK